MAKMYNASSSPKDRMGMRVSDETALDSPDPMKSVYPPQLGEELEPTPARGKTGLTGKLRRKGMPRLGQGLGEPHVRK